MEPTDKVDENELQKAIDNITSVSGGVTTEQDAVAAVANKLAEGGTTEAPAEAGASGATAEAKATYGDPDLSAVKIKALADLRPLVEKVDLSPEAKFKIYREIILATNDKAALEPAYMAAVGIAIEKDKAGALLFIVETIDKLGIGATKE